MDDLQERTNYLFGIRSANNRAMWSTLSNIASGEIQGEAQLTEPDGVVLILARAYNDQNSGEYDLLRHELFEFQFFADEFDLSGTANGRWGRGRDGQSTERMFEGAPNSKGETVQSIDLTIAPEAATGWNDRVEPEFAGTLRQTSCVTMDVVVTPRPQVSQVRGLHEPFGRPKSQTSSSCPALRMTPIERDTLPTV